MHIYTYIYIYITHIYIYKHIYIYIYLAISYLSNCEPMRHRVAAALRTDVVPLPFGRQRLRESVRCVRARSLRLESNRPVLDASPRRGAFGKGQMGSAHLTIFPN